MILRCVEYANGTFSRSKIYCYGCGASEWSSKREIDEYYWWLASVKTSLPVEIITKCGTLHFDSLFIFSTSSLECITKTQINETIFIICGYFDSILSDLFQNGKMGFLKCCCDADGARLCRVVMRDPLFINKLYLINTFGLRIFSVMMRCSCAFSSSLRLVCVCVLCKKLLMASSFVYPLFGRVLVRERARSYTVHHFKSNTNLLGIECRWNETETISSFSLPLHLY